MGEVQHRLLRGSVDGTDVHLWAGRGIAACGRVVTSAQGSWFGAASLVTCGACCALMVPPPQTAEHRSVGRVDALVSSATRALCEDARLARYARLLRLTPTPTCRAPRTVRVIVATIVAVAGSLAADAILVAVGRTLFPGTRNYVHFQFSDYARLTVVGVLAACAAWPLVARVTSVPHWLFLRLAVFVTVVLWLPDLFILWQGQPPSAVGVLMVMHVAIALVTYHALVRVAPARTTATVHTSD